MDEPTTQKQSHKLWRKNVKKLQRKRRRRLAAIKREEELKLRQQSQTYQTQIANEHALELIKLENIRQINEIEHNKWLESESQIERKWRERQLKIEEQTKKANEERRRIQNEFEAQQKRIEQLVEEKKRLLEEQCEREMDLERRIEAFIHDDGDHEMPPELLVEAETNPGKELCSFFTNAATCRFGNKCIHNHKRQKIGKILQVPAFFNHIYLNQNKDTEYGTDSILEHEEKDLYEHFNEFFVDVVPEFERFGEILHFVVCKNSTAHLRGYVYVEYSTERDALKAQRALHGRYYAGRMLNVEICAISWKAAVCGSSLKNNCRKGQNCNFLHVFKNPSDLFSIGRTLRESSTMINSQRFSLVQRKDDWNYNGERNERNWRWSESPIKEIEAKSVGSSEPKVCESQHRDISRNKNRDKSRSRSRSRNQSKSTRKSSKRNVGRSRQNSRKKSPRRSRSPLQRKRSKKLKTRSQSCSPKKKCRRSRKKNSPKNE